jgi:hypothetical protein
LKKFTIPCDFGGMKAPFNIYIGEPRPGHHPLEHQLDWLSRERGGTIPAEVVDSFKKLHDIAQENNVSFEELAVYALGTAQDGSGTADAEGAAGAPVQA